MSIFLFCSSGEIKTNIRLFFGHSKQISNSMLCEAAASGLHLPNFSTNFTIFVMHFRRWHFNIILSLVFFFGDNRIRLVLFLFFVVHRICKTNIANKLQSCENVNASPLLERIFIYEQTYNLQTKNYTTNVIKNKTIFI